MDNDNKKIISQAQELPCKSCGKAFMFREVDRVYLKKDMSVPDICPLCRKAISERKRREAEQKESQKWQIKKAAEKKEFESRIHTWNVIPVESIIPENDRVLYIIGNGFDLMHGVRSSYYSFRDSISKDGSFRLAIDNYITKEDAWADFEDSLAHFKIKAMANRFIVGNALEMTGFYDEDAGAAEFYMAAENAARPILAVSYDLQRRLRMWVEKLTVGTDDRPLRGMFRNGKVLNFNYTEFVESLYGVSEENICYIHGCRRKKKFHPKDKLILGHIPGASDEAFDFNDDSSPITKNKYKLTVIDAAQEQVMNLLSQSDETLTKRCDAIISAHTYFFDRLNDIESVITIGHSFSPVDYDYFTEIVKRHPEIQKARWYFGCHGLSDLLNLEKLLPLLGLKQSDVFVFRTDTIPVKFKSTNHAPTKNVPSKKALSVSENGKWSAKTTGRVFSITEIDSGKTNYEVVFPTGIYDAFFALSDEYLFVKIKGLDAGIVLFHKESEHWQFICELQNIPNQSLINRRLRGAYLSERDLCLVYNSRVRRYSLKDGALIFNSALRSAATRHYEGKDITDLLLRRKA